MLASRSRARALLATQRYARDAAAGKIAGEGLVFLLGKFAKTLDLRGHYRTASGPFRTLTLHDIAQNQRNPPDSELANRVSQPLDSYL